MQSQLPISVCMPMYNASRYLRECIDSILSQTFTDFELLIVDDGSEDDSIAIVESYTDPRIRLIRNRHDYIGSLNLLLKEARGKYIARMDADDVMLPYRLKAQWGYMEKHPHVGILGGGMLQFGDANKRVVSLPKVSILDMIESCCIAHPTTFIRVSILQKYNIYYEEEYKYAEDYRMWMTLLKKGVEFRNLTATLIKYRISQEQVSSKHSIKQSNLTKRIKSEAFQWVLDQIEAAKNEEVYIPKSSNKLTVVIPFLNEGIEVINTVRNVRNTAGSKVDIIVINDYSDDGIDYECLLSDYHVHYVNNQFRIGAAASKERGAQLVKTPFFILLDAHMRCYTNNWHEMIIHELQQDDRRLLCCQTKALTKDKHGIVRDKNVVVTNGAYATFDYNEYLPGIHWSEYREASRLPDNRIACVLGAGYAASKRYWNRIKGLQGLMHYGSEETYMSMKAWMEGGGCYLLPNVTWGHIYRSAPPYRIVTSHMHYNLFVISQTLFPMSLQCWANAIAYQTNKSIYANIGDMLSANKQTIRQLRDYLHTTFTNSFEHVLEVNNFKESSQYEMAKFEKKRLSSLVDYLCDKTDRHNIHLWDGCIGLLLALCEYQLYYKSQQSEEFIAQLLESISDKLTPQVEVPISFAHGICGVGWGYIFLIRKKLTDYTFENELKVIDSKLMERDPQRVTDFTFESGLGGIFCYVVHRLYLTKLGIASSCFDSTYLSSLLEAAKSCLNKDIELRTRSYALQLLCYEKDYDNWEILSPQWKDIIDLPSFLPQNECFWKCSLDSATGYLINLLSILRSLEDKVSL